MIEKEKEKGVNVHNTLKGRYSFPALPGRKCAPDFD